MSELEVRIIADQNAMDGRAPTPMATGQTVDRIILAFIVLGALLLRTMFLLVSLQDPDHRQMTNDSYGYMTLAQNLANGQGFGRLLTIGSEEPKWIPELCRTPGYPAFLSIPEAINLDSRFWTIVLQHAMGVAICVLVSIFTRGLFGRTAGLVAALLLALDIQGTGLANQIRSEVLFGFLLLLAALSAARLCSGTPSHKWALITGGFLGLSALVRPTSLFLPTLLTLSILITSYARRSRRTAIVAITLMLAGNFTIFTWTVRNGVRCGEYIFSTLGRFQLVHCHAADTLARARGIGNRQKAFSELCQSIGIPPERIRFCALSADQRNALGRVVRQTLWAYKGAFLVDYSIRSANFLFGPDKDVLNVLGLPWVHFDILESGGKGADEVPLVAWGLLAAQVILLGITYLLVVRTIWRIVLRKSRQPALVWICLLFALCLLGISAGSPGHTRYRWPAIPLLTIVAVATLGPKYVGTRSTSNA